MLRYLPGIRTAFFTVRRHAKKAKIALKPIPAASGGSSNKCQRNEIACLYEGTRCQGLYERACCAHFRGSNASIAMHRDRRSASQGRDDRRGIALSIVGADFIRSLKAGQGPENGKAASPEGLPATLDAPTVRKSAGRAPVVPELVAMVPTLHSCRSPF